MNFIINSFHNKIFFPLLSETLNNFDVKYAHLTYTDSKLDIPTGLEAIFHNIKDLVAGDYDVNWEEIIPLDECLIERMNDCEVVVLKMMDRLPYKLSSSYDERKRLYLKHLRYWNHIIEKNTINLFLSSSPPHEIYDFIIYHLCKLKKIPTILFFQTNISDTIAIMEDCDFTAKPIQMRYQQLLEKYQSLDESEIPLLGRGKRDFELNTAKKDSVPFYMLREKPSHNIINNLTPLLVNLNCRRFLLLIRKPSLLIRSMVDHINYIDRIMRGKRMFEFYENNTSVPDFSQKYIYFPLHMQPESSTSPMAGAYVEQILIVQMIAYHLPEDVYIYIKENPHQTVVGRSVEFYKELLEISQVRLMPLSSNTFGLINNSLAVATATGTAGWEALYRCKPVLMFGHNFYQYAKGVFQIKNNSDCQLALKEILLNNFKPTIKDLKIFLKALEDVTIDGYIDIDYKINTYIDDNVNNENILQKLIDEIKTVCC